MNYLNLNWNYGYEVSEECEMYEFEGDSLSQDSYDLSINEPESALECTLYKLMEIKQVENGEYVLLKDNKVAERGSYRKCNEMLDAYIDVYEWINGISNKLNQ
jgi:hypothetical protein